MPPRFADMKLGLLQSLHFVRDFLILFMISTSLVAQLGWTLLSQLCLLQLPQLGTTLLSRLCLLQLLHFVCDSFKLTDC